MLYYIDNVFQKLKVYSLIGFLLSVIPKNKNKIIFTSFPNFSDYVLIFYEYMKNKYPEKKLIWITLRGNSNNCDKIFNSHKFLSIEGLFHFFTAKVVFTNNNEFFRFKANNQILIDFWHGIPIKNIFKYDKSSSKLISTFAYRTNHRISSSRLISILLSSAFGDNIYKYIESGSLRNDRILDSCPENVYNLLNLSRKKKYFIYLPTYRTGYRDKKDGILKNNYLHQSKDFLNYCKSINAEILVKVHPFDRNKFESNKIVHFINDEILSKNNLTLFDVFTVTYMMITDFSSLYYDYIITNKPALIYSPDYKIFKERRGFIINPKLISFNKIFLTPQELINFINSSDLADYVKKQKNLSKVVHDKIDNKNCKRLGEELKKIYPDVF